MSGPEFEISISWNTTHVALACSGELDMANDRQFREAVDLCLSKGPRSLLIDMTDLSFFGSEGLRALLQVVDRCAERETELIVWSGDVVAKVVDLAGVAELIPERTLAG